MTATQLAELLFFEPSLPPRDADFLLHVVIVSSDEALARRISQLIAFTQLDGIHVEWVSDVVHAESLITAKMADVVIVDEALGMLPSFRLLHVASRYDGVDTILVGTERMGEAAGRLCDPFGLSAYWSRTRLNITSISSALVPIVEAAQQTRRDVRAQHGFEAMSA